MKKTNLKPIIFTTISVAATIGTTITAVMATPKALKAIEEVKREKNVDILPKKEVVKACWKYYIPSAALLITGVGSIIAAECLNKQNYNKLMGAFTLLKSSHKRLVDKINDNINEDSLLSNEKIAEYMDTDKEDDVLNEEAIFYDIYSGRQFIAPIGELLKAEANLNARLLVNGFVSINDWYECLNKYLDDLIELKIEYDSIGWDIDDNAGIFFAHEISNFKGKKGYVIMMSEDPSIIG